VRENGGTTRDEGAEVSGNKVEAAQGFARKDQAQPCRSRACLRWAEAAYNSFRLTALGPLIGLDVESNALALSQRGGRCIIRSCKSVTATMHDFTKVSFAEPLAENRTFYRSP
jgi:hypothetical protein